MNKNEQRIIEKVKAEIAKGNLDNISRTVFYHQYNIRNPEIKWSYLAGYVSRNAGWAMTDLCSKPYQQLLNGSLRKRLFMAYERANWLIFSDAFPQLLIYEQSKRDGEPYFHLLSHFGVSQWIVKKWCEFWRKKNEEKLLVAQIVNEQAIIQKPVIDQAFYRKYVFKTSAFKWQDRLHFSTVLFPTKEGQIFGCSVHNFTQIEKRVELGRKLAWILFHAPEREALRQFHESVVHSGSRHDYQQFSARRYPKTPILRWAFPVVRHNREYDDDWVDYLGFNPNRLVVPLELVKKYNLTDWYEGKVNQMQMAAIVERFYNWVSDRTFNKKESRLRKTK